MIVYGKQIFLYLLERHREKIQEVYLSKEIDKRLFQKIVSKNIPIKRVDTKKAQAMARGGNHQGFILKTDDFEFSRLSEIKRGDFVLILSGLTDVGNIGAIVRSAYALGVDGIVISKISTINVEGVARASAGALFDMPIVLEKDLNSVINELKQVGFLSYCADMSGEDIRKVKTAKKRVLIMGSEGEGLSKKILSNCDKIVKIEMQREFDSLNVSTACAILCDRMRDGK